MGGGGALSFGKAYFGGSLSEFYGIMIVCHLFLIKNDQIPSQDSEWEVIDKPGQSSSPQVSRKDQKSSSSQGKSHTEPPTSLPSSPAKKKESSSATSEGTTGSVFTS